MARIREFCVGRLDTIGQVCLLGRSTGCQLALALAARLNKEGVEPLTFVGVSDVPMFDTGRIPPVKLVGDFKPINGPIGSGAVAPTPSRASRFGNTPLPHPDTEIPLVKLGQQIKARKKINLYQTQGNHMKYSGSAAWMWWSETSVGEVHGQLIGDDFDNRLRHVNVPPWYFQFHSPDYYHHVNLNTGEHWKQMCQEAATAFADFPSAVYPP